LGKNKRYPTSFFVNTKRFRSSISQELALELGWLKPEDLLWYQKAETGEKVPVIGVSFVLNNKKIKTEMLVSRQLDKSKNKVHLGRRDLKQFIVRAEEVGE
jgi:serine protease inhibitor ecotin